MSNIHMNDYLHIFLLFLLSYAFLSLFFTFTFDDT